MSAATVNCRGQITIPLDVRLRMRLRAGDRVEFIEVAPGRFDLVVPTHSIKALKGMFQHSGVAVSIKEMNRAIKHRSISRANTPG